MFILRGVGKAVAAVATWWGVLTLFGFGAVAALVTYLIHAPWWVQACVGAGFVLAVALLIRDRRYIFTRARAAITDLLSPPMTEEHRDFLRKIAERVSSSVTQRQVANYGGPREAEDFRAHFPGLAHRLDEWEDARSSEVDSAIQARVKMAELLKASCPSPPFHLPTLTGRFHQYIEAGLERRPSSVPDPPIVVIEDDWLGGGDPVIVWQVNNEKSLLATRDPDNPVAAQAMIDSVQGVLRDFLASDEWKQAKSDRDARQVAQARITEQAQLVRTNSHLHRHCPDCSGLRKNTLYEVPG